MKKRLFGILFAVLLCLSLSVPAFAQGNMPLLVDNADLLTDSEESALLSKLANISSNQQTDIVIVTVNDLDGKTPRDYADDFYDFNCYAEDGVLLLISMENSDWYISTSGYGITAVTDAGREYMAEQFVDDLGDGDYYDAFVTYADLCDEFINMARSGDPFDVDDLAILQNVVAANYGISKTDLERLRGICVNEVKKINGSITFDEAIRWQS